MHGRTREQKGANSGFASWRHIKAIKEALKIPVVANGNMIYHENIQECFEFTGADGIMIAEPHLYNPCIFCKDQKNALEIFEEFLDILKTEKHIFFGGLKSHAFKIFHSVFLKLPDLRIKLDKSKNLEDYFEFKNHLKSLIKDNIINEDALTLKPYIRSHDPIKTNDIHMSN